MSRHAPTFHVIIPARYASVRLPGKPLLDLRGRPLIEHVHAQATRSHAASVTVATDDERIHDVVAAFGGAVWMTDPAHPSGTDRVAEAARHLGFEDTALIVNLQGDEPLMPPALIDQVALCLSEHHEAHIATACEPILDPQLFADPSVVKVVCDQQGHALYFSRASVPAQHTGVDDPAQALGLAARHIGIYAYRMQYLQTLTSRPVSQLEQVERLEQLRALWHGDTIAVCRAVATPGPGIDTLEDLRQVNMLLAID